MESGSAGGQLGSWRGQGGANNGPANGQQISSRGSERAGKGGEGRPHLLAYGLGGQYRIVGVAAQYDLVWAVDGRIIALQTPVCNAIRAAQGVFWRERSKTCSVTQQVL